MKILHWDEMFHPTFGYQINVLAKYQAKQGHEVIIMTSQRIKEHPTFKGLNSDVDIELEDLKYSQKYNVKIIRLPIHGFYSGRVIYKRGFLNEIKKINPDVLMCHTSDTLSSIIITKNLKKLNIPVVFDNHMLSMGSRNPLSKLFHFYYRKFVAPIIVKNKLITIRTQDDRYVNDKLGLPEELTPYISFGTDTQLFKPDQFVRDNFRKEHQIDSNAFVVVYTGKLDEAKGGVFLSQTITKKLDCEREVIFIVVGTAKDDEYGRKVEENFASSENRVLRFNTQAYEELPKFYQASDLCLFAKQCSLSFFDAQSCGLPVVFEDNNINVDRAKHNNAWTFQKNNLDDFRKAILYAARLNCAEYEVYSQNARRYILENFDYEDIAKQYTQYLSSALERFRHDKKYI